MLDTTDTTVLRTHSSAHTIPYTGGVQMLAVSCEFSSSVAIRMAQIHGIGVVRKGDLTSVISDDGVVIPVNDRRGIHGPHIMTDAERHALNVVLGELNDAVDLETAWFNMALSIGMKPDEITRPSGEGLFLRMISRGGVRWRLQHLWDDSIAVLQDVPGAPELVFVVYSGSSDHTQRRLYRRLLGAIKGVRATYGVVGLEEVEGRA